MADPRQDPVISKGLASLEAEVGAVGEARTLGAAYDWIVGIDPSGEKKLVDAVGERIGAEVEHAPADLADLRSLARRGRCRRWGEDPAEAAALVDRVLGIGSDSKSSPPRFRLIDDQEIEALPKPEFLIDGVFPVGGLIVTYGPPGSFKTFLALDWSLCIASGFPWQSRSVQSGPVIYVAAEGSAGLGSRVRAWKANRGYAGRAGVNFITEPVVLLELVHLDDVIRQAGQLEKPPALVVFDTLARCMAGYDENDTGDMGGAVAGADRIRRELGAATMLIHHTNASGERERGNTALRGAADTMIECKLDDDIVTVKCSKQKDAPAFPSLRFLFDPVGDSGIVQPLTAAREVDDGRLTEKQLEALLPLKDADIGDGLTMTAWLKVSEVSEASLYRYRKAFIDKGLVEQAGNGRGSRFQLTETGRNALTLNLSTPSHEPLREGAANLSITGGPLEGPPGERLGRETGAKGPPFVGPDEELDLKLDEDPEIGGGDGD